MAHNVRLNIVFWNVPQDCCIVFCSMWRPPTTSFAHLVAALIHCDSLDIHSHTLHVKLSWAFGPTADLSQSHNESPSAFSTRPSEWVIRARMSRTGRSLPTCARMSNSTVTGGLSVWSAFSSAFPSSLSPSAAASSLDADFNYFLLGFCAYPMKDWRAHLLTSTFLY